MPDSGKYGLSVVVSVYNELPVLIKFEQELRKVLDETGLDFELIFVNDGSTDGSRELLDELCYKNQKYKAIHFSRNFGHESAMAAGIDHSSGEAVICMDADLQHPPECIPGMIEQFNSGYEIVNMVRTDRKDHNIIMKIMSKQFYNLLNRISTMKIEPNGTDFFLISRRVADILNNDFRERTRFMRGFIQVIGFNKTSLEFKAPERYAGKSKYSLLKLIILSFSAVATFSNVPLYLGLFAGAVFGIFSIAVGIYSIIMKFIMGFVLPGYTTLVVLISFLFGLLFFIIGIIGQYIGYLFIEQKQRPVYIIDSISGGNKNN
ncbi:MAG: glycosyltransferase family 2 protein [Bacteroidota bacterium]